MRSKLVVAISDTHCGHINGLTIPAWIPHPARHHKSRPWLVQAWGMYMAMVRQLGAPDLLIHCGDAVSLTDPDWGGGEQLVSDPEEIPLMAAEVLRVWRARCVVVCRGTRRHVAQGGIEIEDRIGEHLDLTTTDHAFVRVNGHMIDARHHAGNTETDASLRAEVRANREWHERGVQPLANSVLRGHVHRARYSSENGWQAVGLPGLQGWTSYGSRRCRKPIDWGLAWAVFDHAGKGQWTIERHTLASAVSKIMVV